MNFAEILCLLNHVWYFCLFPVVAIIVKGDKEVPLLFFAILLWNHITFDVVGVPDNVWFLVQAIFSFAFFVSCRYIAYPLLRQACRILCLYIVMINLMEQFSMYQTIFYDWWEIINWIALDLLAMCLILNSKILNQKSLTREV